MIAATMAALCLFFGSAALGQAVSTPPNVRYSAGDFAEVPEFRPSYAATPFGEAVWAGRSGEIPAVGHIRCLAGTYPAILGTIAHVPYETQYAIDSARASRLAYVVPGESWDGLWAVVVSTQVETTGGVDAIAYCADPSELTVNGREFGVALDRIGRMGGDLRAHTTELNDHAQRLATLEDWRTSTAEPAIMAGNHQWLYGRLGVGVEASGQGIGPGATLGATLCTRNGLVLDIEATATASSLVLGYEQRGWGGSAGARFGAGGKISLSRFNLLLLGQVGTAGDSRNGGIPSVRQLSLGGAAQVEFGANRGWFVRARGASSSLASSYVVFQDSERTWEAGFSAGRLFW